MKANSQTSQTSQTTQTTQINIDNISEDIRDRMLELLATWENIMILKGLRVPNTLRVRFNLNSMRVLGQCGIKRGECTIRVHKALLLEDIELYLNSTFKHEYAHAVQFVNFRGSKSHGKEFKAICSYMGLIGRATNNSYRNSKVLKELREKKGKKSKKIFRVFCGCNDKKVSKLIYNRMAKGTKYRCTGCKELIKISI